MEALVDDLQHLRSRVGVTLGTGVRKITELLELRIENVNFRGFSIFRPATGRDVEARPNWFLLVDTKGQRASSSRDANEWSGTSRYEQRYSKSFTIERAGAYLTMPILE